MTHPDSNTGIAKKHSQRTSMGPSSLPRLAARQGLHFTRGCKEGYQEAIKALLRPS
jgi:hypothetical protein